MLTTYLFIFVAVIAAVFAFVMFGTHFITNLIDNKIGEIRVNVPQIRVDVPHVQPNNPQIVFRIAEDDKGRIIVNSANETTATKKKCRQRRTKLEHPNKIQLYEPFLAVDFEEQSPDEPMKTVPNSELDGPIVVSTSEPPTHPRVLVGCRTDDDCNVVNGDGKNVCKSDGTCSCIGGGSGTFCHYGPVKYRDPKDMTADELQRFKSKYRNDFTLQDYKNWLMLYKSDPENLREQHRRNLRILLQGGQLTPKDLPHIQMRSPTNASDYFQKMYRGGNIAVHFPDSDSPYVGANYRDYGDFEPPENVASTWITGVVNAYKTEKKDDAKSLNWYMLPEVTTGEDEQRPGDIYQKYIEKHHNSADVRAIWNNTQTGGPMTITRGQNDLQTL